MWKTGSSQRPNFTAFLPPPHVQRLCPAARRSRTCFIEQVGARWTDLSVSCSASVPAADGLASPSSGRRPNSCPSVRRRASQGEGFPL